MPLVLGMFNSQVNIKSLINVAFGTTYTKYHMSSVFIKSDVWRVENGVNTLDSKPERFCDFWGQTLNVLTQ